MAAKFEIELAKRIKHLRERAGLSQAELAKLSRKSVETISNFERGKTLPSIRTLVLLAKHLECGVAEFFNSIEPEKSDQTNANKVILSKLKLIDADDRVLLEQIAELLARRG